MNPKSQSPALTIERFASDCLDVLMLYLVNAFRDQWLRVSFPFRWPKITKMRVARYGIWLHLSQKATRRQVPVTWTRCRFGGAGPWPHQRPVHKLAAARLIGGTS